MSIIYKTINLVNGKFYVGQHFTSADDGYLGSGKYLKRAVKKHGKENFVRETLEYCTSANVDVREIHWIRKLNATNNDIAYNFDEGGKGVSGYIISKSKLEYYKTEKGNLHKIESSKRMKILNKKYDWTGSNNPNYINAINSFGENNNFYGKQHTLESKIKISESKSKFNYYLENLKTNEIKSFHSSLKIINFCIKNSICTKSTIEQIIWRSGKLPHIFRKGWKVSRKLIMK
jgi:group I intron endonuclease